MNERRMKEALPDAVLDLMRQIGEDICAARKARKMTQDDLAQRLNVTRKVIFRMENGDPTVSFGVYASTAWVMGLDATFAKAFSPQEDVIFQKGARLDLPKRVRNEAEATLGDLDF